MPKLLIFIGKDDFGFWFWLLPARVLPHPWASGTSRGPPGRYPKRSREGERPYVIGWGENQKRSQDLSFSLELRGFAWAGISLEEAMIADFKRYLLMKLFGVLLQSHLP